MLHTLAFKPGQLLRHRKGPILTLLILMWIAHDQPATLSGGIPMICYTRIGVHPLLQMPQILVLLRAVSIWPPVIITFYPSREG